jgi:hypothetical protein
MTSRARVLVRLRTADNSKSDTTYLTRLPHAGEVVATLPPSGREGFCRGLFVVGMVRHFANTLPEAREGVLEGECIGQFFDNEERFA